MKIGGKEIYNTFFVQVIDKKHKCKICEGTYSQDIKKGYTNLVTHLQKEHPGWEESMKLNIDNNPFFHKKGNNIFNWLSWIIEDNLPFSFVERPNTRKFSKLDPISVDTLMKYMKLTTERVEKRLQIAFLISLVLLSMAGKMEPHITLRYLLAILTMKE